MAATNRITSTPATPALQLVRGGMEKAKPEHGRTAASAVERPGVAGRLSGVAANGEARRSGSRASGRADARRGGCRLTGAIGGVDGGAGAGVHVRLVAGDDGSTGTSAGASAGTGAGSRAGSRPRPCASRVVEGVDRAATARAHAASRELRDKLAMALEHAELLTVMERDILHAIAEQGFTVKALARVSERSERDIRRTLRAVAARADAPLFPFVAKTRRIMPPRLRAVAEAVVLRGASLREAAEELGLTVWAVRIHRDKLLTRFVTRERT